MNLKELYDQKKEQLYFIELNKDLHFGEITIPKGLDLPVDQDVLKDVVTENQEGFDFKRILRDVCLVLGLDPEFVHNPVYESLVKGMVAKPFDYCMHLGVKASENRQWLEAISFFRAALRFEDHIDAYFNLGKAHYAFYMEQNTLIEALKLSKVNFEKALHIEKKSVILYYLAFVAHHQERHQEALRLAKMAIADDLPEIYAQDLLPKLSVLEDKARYELGYDLILHDRFLEGLEALFSISEDAQDDWRIQFFIGLGYRGLNQLEESMLHLSKARNLNQTDDRILNELGIVAMMLDDFQGSKEFFMEGLRLKPLNYEILCNLAILYIEARKLDLARKFIAEAILIAPEDEIVQRTKAYLEGLGKTDETS